MFNAWQDQGFPRAENNIYYNRYLLARKRFHSLVKRYKSQSTIHHYINVDKLRKCNPKTYWKQIKIARTLTQKLFTINGKTKHEEITTEFKTRTPNTNNEETNK